MTTQPSPSAATVEPTPEAKPATQILNWRHPNPKVGEHEEPLCDEHAKPVHDALLTLGIGCIGWAPDEPTACVRCGKQLPWRYYLFPSPPIYVSQKCPTCGDTYTSDVPIRIAEHVGPDNHVFIYPEGPPTDG